MNRENLKLRLFYTATIKLESLLQFCLSDGTDVTLKSEEKRIRFHETLEFLQRKIQSVSFSIRCQTPSEILKTSNNVPCISYILILIRKNTAFL